MSASPCAGVSALMQNSCKVSAVAASGGLPNMKPKLGRTATRRAQRSYALMCWKLGAVAAAAATPNMEHAAEASGVYCDLCGIWTPLPLSNLAPSEPRLAATPFSLNALAPEFVPGGTRTDHINSPGLSDSGWAPTLADPVEANAALDQPTPEKLLKTFAEKTSEGNNLHDCISSGAPAGSSLQKHMKKYIFRRTLHVPSIQYSTDASTGECKTQ